MILPAHKSVSFLSVLALVLTACASATFVPAPRKLQAWSVALRDQQPDRAFAAVYAVGSRRLVFVGARHTERNDSDTFRLIRDAFAMTRFDTVIAEGFPTSWGINPDRIVKRFAAIEVRPDGTVPGGETVPTVIGARQQTARLIGGEPEDRDVQRSVAADGVSDVDLLGFAVLRVVPQWIDERRIGNASDPRLAALVTRELIVQRASLGLPDTVLADYRTWLAWYSAVNQKPLSASFTTEEVGPLADGPFGTNRIAYAISRARDSHLHRLAIASVNRGGNVLIVFGGSHLMIHRPALDAVLGPPCYFGSDLSRATVSCT